MRWERYRRIGVSTFFSVSQSLLLLFPLELPAVDSIIDARYRVVSLSVEGKGLPRRVLPGIKVGDTVDFKAIEAGKEELKQRLFDLGFLVRQVTVETVVNEKGVKITYLIVGISRTRFGGWSFEGISEVLPRVVARTPIKGAVLNAKLMNKFEEKIANFYREAGYPWVWVGVVGVAETAGFLFPVVRIDTGPKVLISFITFSGKSQNSEPLLMRYAGFKKNVPYSTAVVNNLRRGVERSGWVVIDSQDIVMRRDGAYGVRYWISTYRNGEILGVAGYLPEERRWTGWGRLRLLNLMNSGRRIEGEWRSVPWFSYYSLSYSEPWVFRLPVELKGAIEHNVFDTSYSFTTLSLTSTFSAGNAGFSVGAGLDRTAGQESNTTRWLGSGLTFDSRDRLVNARSGLWARFFTRAGQRNQKEKNGVITKVEIYLEPFIPLTGNFVLVNRFACRLAFANYEMVVPELYRMGGILNVRGYRDGVFVTPKAGWWNCELRYNFSTMTRAQLFFDAGTFQNSAGNCQFLAGYGLGGRWGTKVGVVGIDYGLGWAKSVWQGKVHFSFEAGF